MTIHLHEGDLPEGIAFGDSVAVDTETMGLRHGRDRLCLVQLSAGDGTSHLVRIPRAATEESAGGTAPRLGALLADPDVLKIFHFARFDLAALANGLGIACAPIYCTKIASKLVRTYTDRHGLRDLCGELLGVTLDKQQQSSDWGAPELTLAQQGYAAQDVLHLHALRAKLDEMLEREGRRVLAEACFRFLPTRVALDLAGWQDEDIFAH